MTVKSTKATTSTKAEEIDAAKSAENTSNAVSSLITAYFSVGDHAMQGIVEVDKALLGYAKEAVNSYVELGKDTVQAKGVNDVIELHTAFAHARIENNVANAREVVELTKEKAKTAYAPIQKIIDTYRATKAA